MHPQRFVADVANLAPKPKAVLDNSDARVALTLACVVLDSHPASVVRALKCTNTIVPGWVPYECAYFTYSVLFTLSAHYLRRSSVASAFGRGLERTSFPSRTSVHSRHARRMLDALSCLRSVHDDARLRRRTLASSSSTWPQQHGPLSRRGGDDDRRTAGPPVLLAGGRKETALTPLRFGVRTKVSLRADGFVPVLHLQCDVAIAVNALSGMQGVPARSPVYLLEPLLGLLPRTRRLRFVLRDFQEELGGRLQCAFSWSVSSPCECVSAFFFFIVEGRAGLHWLIRK